MVSCPTTELNNAGISIDVVRKRRGHASEIYTQLPTRSPTRNPRRTAVSYGDGSRD